MHVVLVGAEFEENLAIRYLRGALEHASHRVTQLVFNRADQIEEVARAIAASGAELTGFSMVFTYRAREFARLATRARELGYAGHMIAGGHFAAFHPERLLKDVPALDSVAIGEGEDLLLALAASLDRPDSVRGIVYRDGDAIRRAPPATNPPDLDRLPWPPRKSPLDDYLGLPITNMLASRGCGYSCTFCSIVAWHRLCGGERVRLRSVESVADEMASLHRAGARIFNFHDDNFFLDDKAAMLARIEGLARALRERRVHDIAFAVKARPGAVDEEVFSVLKSLGLFRVFLGIEAGTAEALKRLGRRQTVAENTRALAIVNRLDIHTCFNVLLFNPDSSLEDVGDNVEFLRHHPENPTNFCRTEIYAGTPLETKLAREQRLRGDYWGLSYEIGDPRAQAAFELAYFAFKTRNYGEQGLHHLAMAVDYEHQLASHFFGEKSDLRARVKAFVREVNVNTCDHLDEIVAACVAGFADPAERRAFAERMRSVVEADNRRLGKEAERLLAEVRARVRAPAESTRNWARTARVVGLAASVSLAATACKRNADDSHPTEMVAPPPTLPLDASGTPPEAAPPEVAAPDGSAADGSAVPEAGPPDAGPADASPDARDAGKKTKPGPQPTHPSEMAPRPPRPTHPNEMAPAPFDDE